MSTLNFILLQAKTSPKGFDMTALILPLAIILIFYMFFIRPQMKKTKEQRKFRDNLKEGDRVVTIGGVHGKIVKVMETTFLLEIGDNNRIKIEKSAVAMPSQEPSVEKN